MDNWPLAANGQPHGTKSAMLGTSSVLANPRRKHDWLMSLCFGCPTPLLALQQGVILYHVTARCKGPIVLIILELVALVRRELSFDHSILAVFILETRYPSGRATFRNES